jgi:hypothetical protein
MTKWERNIQFYNKANGTNYGDNAEIFRDLYRKHKAAWRMAVDLNSNANTVLTQLKAYGIVIQPRGGDRESRSRVKHSILEVLDAHPEYTNREVASRVKCVVNYVGVIRRRFRKRPVVTKRQMVLDIVKHENEVSLSEVASRVGARVSYVKVVLKQEVRKHANYRAALGVGAKVSARHVKDTRTYWTDML